MSCRGTSPHTPARGQLAPSKSNVLYLWREAALDQDCRVEALGHIEQKQVVPLGQLPLPTDETIAVCWVNDPADVAILES